MKFEKMKLMKFFIYDNQKGLLVWKDHWCKNKTKFIGKIAGNIHTFGSGLKYRDVGLGGRKILTHKIIYFLETGETPEVIDHIDGNGLNNHISNLRSVSTRQNCQNRKTHRSGRLVGSHFSKEKKLWVSQIRIKGKKKWLGYFTSEKEAHERYIKEVIKLETK